jgi:hypothetical protein
MATLNITINALTSTKTVTNARATNVLLNVYRRYHPGEDPGATTNQQKLDWIVGTLIPHLLTQESRAHKEATTVAQFNIDFNSGDEVFE